MIISVSTAKHCLELIKGAKSLVITNHVNPDGDAVGSALGLRLLLQAIDKDPQVIMPNSYPDFLQWMKGNSEVVFYDQQTSEAEQMLSEADLIIHLDYSTLSRSGPMQKALGDSRAARIVIDHHQQPEDFADILISDTNMSSTCEMVYHFAKALGLKDSISLESAECLYTGIITDTGSFRFSGTTPLTHEVAGHLMTIGVKPHEIASRVYDNNSLNRMGLLGRTLDRLEVVAEYNTALMSLRMDDLEEFAYQKGDTEGFVNYGLSLKGINLSIFLTEKADGVKISFRSKGSFDVNRMARELFNGGGHVNAAGALSDLNLEDSLNKIKGVLPNYQSQLQSTN